MISEHEQITMEYSNKYKAIFENMNGYEWSKLFNEFRPLIKYDSVLEGVPIFSISPSEANWTSTKVDKFLGQFEFLLPNQPNWLLTSRTLDEIADTFAKHFDRELRADINVSLCYRPLGESLKPMLLFSVFLDMAVILRKVHAQSKISYYEDFRGHIMCKDCYETEMAYDGFDYESSMYTEDTVKKGYGPICDYCDCSITE